MTTRDEAKHFRQLASEALSRRWKTAGLDMVSEEVREALLYAEAARLVMAQAGEKYEPAQTLIQRCMGWTTEHDR